MENQLPLKGINILDLTQVLSGPFATLVLSDLGANVIKVEKSKGDDSRSFGPIKKNKSGYFISLNRGKKSIKLDLKEKKDKRIFSDLIKKTDILVENFKVGVLGKLGFSWSKLKKNNPRLVYAKISGFGESGPYKHLPAYDVIVQAMGGIMSITGSSENNFTRVGSSIGDITAGLYCVIGILAALNERNKTNLGKKIDISMLDCQVAILENAITRYSVSKKIPHPLGTDHPSISPFGAFKAKNSPVVLAAGNQKIFENLCKAISRNDLIQEKKFLDNELRNKNLKLLRKEIEKTLITKNAEYWIKKLRTLDVPCCKIENVKSLIKNPQIQNRNMILDYVDDDFGKINVVGNPIKIEGVKESKVASKAPDLDQNRRQILKEFGIT